jgi:hypothetical protein
MRLWTVWLLLLPGAYGQPIGTPASVARGDKLFAQGCSAFARPHV